jgi:hypothetical protein
VSDSIEALVEKVGDALALQMPNPTVAKASAALTALAERVKKAEEERDHWKWDHTEASKVLLARAEAAEADLERLRRVEEAARDCRLAMLGEQVDIMWSNGGFWIDELARALAAGSEGAER